MKTLWSVVGIAAMIGLMAFLFWLLKPEEIHKEKTKIADVLLDQDAILDYLAETDNLDEETIFSAFPDNRCENLKVVYTDPVLSVQDSILPETGNEELFALDSTITAEDILQYLLDEGFEVIPGENY